MAQATDLDSDSFAARLNLALKALNFSRGQLASAVGVDKSLVSRWLSGQVRPTSHNLARISDVFAKMKPGFNMTLWERPLPEFEAFFGLRPETAPAQVAAVDPVATPPKPFPMWAGAAALVIALIAVATAMFWPPASAPPTHPPVPVTQSVPAPPPNSIAVLPFVNMSGDAANDYFSDGVSEEILNELANTPNLRVVARTSSFTFKGTRTDIAEIGRRLHVRAILEGSVRENGNRVRITAQLVNAADGFHMWSQTYDRDLGDVLKVQAEIARAIAVALTKEMASADAPPAPQVDPEAYRKYLQAKFAFERRDENGTKSAIRLLDEAVALQPDFADAHALKAFALLNANYNFIYRADAALLAQIDYEVNRALAIDPRNMMALYVNFHRAMYSQNWNVAMALVRRMRAISPAHVLVMRASGFLCGAFGLVDCAEHEAELATRADPVSFPAWANYQVLTFVAGHHKASINAGETALALQPDTAIVVEWLCLAYLKDGQHDRARAAAARLQAMPEARALVGCSIPLAVTEGNRAEAERIADARAATAIADHVDLYFVAESYLDAGNFGEASAWFARSYAAQEAGLYAAEYDRTLPREFFRMPAWLALKRQPRFVAWQQARDKLAKELGERAQ